MSRRIMVIEIFEDEAHINDDNHYSEFRYEVTQNNLTVKMDATIVHYLDDLVQYMNDVFF